MRFACVLNPHSASSLLTWFIRKVEMVGRIKAEATLSGEERARDGGNGGLGIGGSGTIGRLKITVVIRKTSVVISIGIVKLLSGRRGRGGVIRLPEGAELP